MRCNPNSSSRKTAQQEEEVKTKVNRENNGQRAKRMGKNLFQIRGSEKIRLSVTPQHD
jgi:hypothetical protein